MSSIFKSLLIIADFSQNDPNTPKYLNMLKAPNTECVTDNKDYFVVVSLQLSAFNFLEVLPIIIQ